MTILISKVECSLKLEFELPLYLPWVIPYPQVSSYNYVYMKLHTSWTIELLLLMTHILKIVKTVFANNAICQNCVMGYTKIYIRPTAKCAVITTPYI